MQRIFLLLSLLVVFGLSTTPVMAQTLYLTGGIGVPNSSNFSDLYQTGYGLGLGVGYFLTPQLEGVGRVNYYRFGVDTSELDLPDGVDVDGGAFSSFSGTANLKYNFSIDESSSVKPYGIGGVGLFRLAVSDQELSAEGFEPVTVEGDNEVNFGFQIGAGLSFETSLATFLVEPGYVIILDDEENIRFFPIRVGALFSL